MPRNKRMQEKRRTWLMPQEVEVWYILPALRRALTRILINKNIPQRQIAAMLGVTEPAITQYKLEQSNRARGNMMTIPQEFIPEIERAADNMIAAWEHRKSDSPTIYLAMTRELNRLIKLLRAAGVTCSTHRAHCEFVEENCDACK